MEKRTEVIQEWIDARRERGEAATKCMFYITVPKDTDLYKDETIKKIEGILDKNHVSHGHVDTVCGAWNLNRDWIETGEIDCIVEFCGVYPVNWDMRITRPGFRRCPTRRSACMSEEGCRTKRKSRWP